MKQFSSDEILALEKFVCDNTRFYFTTRMDFDQFILGNATYAIDTEFDGICKMQRWQDKTVKFSYFMAYGPYKEQFVGKKLYVG